MHSALSLGAKALAHFRVSQYSGDCLGESFYVSDGNQPAGVLIVLMIRRSRPNLTTARLGLIVVALALLLLLAALGSLDAGGNSFEF